MTLEQKTTHEASLDLLKFFRLFYVRITTQGIRATFLWMYNVLNRLLIDVPIKSLSQITSQLYLGGQFRRRGWRELKKWGITAVVNLRDEFDDRKVGVELGNYHYIPTVDDDVPSLDQLMGGVEFISHEIVQGGKVYVHCGSGVGRAPTMVAAYLVTLGSDPETAWETIRKVRPFIRPTRVQREQISRLAESRMQPQS